MKVTEPLLVGYGGLVGYEAFAPLANGEAALDVPASANSVAAMAATTTVKRAIRPCVLRTRGPRPDLIIGSLECFRANDARQSVVRVL